MKNTKFFDIVGFREFLDGNFSGVINSCPKKCRDDLYVEEGIQSSSFQFVDCDFLLSQSVTCGNYRNGEGYYEELRMKFGKIVHFRETVHIPSGKYRIRVDQFGDNLPHVGTFVRGVWGWKHKPLPEPLDISRILVGSLENYNID